MTHIVLIVGYDGTRFHGWAHQPGLRTVESELTSALCVLTQTPVTCIVAGRTDAGVHARHQVVLYDIPDNSRLDLSDASRLAGKLNRLLRRHGDNDIVVRHATCVDKRFNPRFGALSRTYCYRIADGYMDYEPTRHDVTCLHYRLDENLMDKAGQAFVGEHDFLAFAKPREGASTVREVFSCHVQRVNSTGRATVLSGDETRYGDKTTALWNTSYEWMNAQPSRRSGIIEIWVHGDAFCHSQVRFMVGALIDVGRAHRPVEWIKETLDACRRDSKVQLAPPQGLTLEAVEYPSTIEEVVTQCQVSQRLRVIEDRL